jgi:hypothetical protein
MLPPLRTSGLTLLALTALAVAALPARLVRSADDAPAVKPGPLDGAWKLVESKNGDAQEYTKLPDGMEMTKFVTGGRFVWAVVREGKVVSAAGGKYAVDKDKYTETIDYTLGEGNDSLAGKTFEFTWKVENGTWLHVGVLKLDGQEVKIDEKWERCK